jgi:hypothetical protein
MRFGLVTVIDATGLSMLSLHLVDFFKQFWQVFFSQHETVASVETFLD